MFDTLKSLNPLKLFPALKESFAKAQESKDKGFFEKVSIFFSTFMSEMGKVDEEKKAAGEEAKKEVEKGVDETLVGAKTAMAVEAPADESEKANFEIVLATAVKNLKSLEADDETNAHMALKKLEKSIAGNTEAFTFEEATATGAVALGTLSDLKKQFPRKEDLKAALDLYEKTTAKSKYPLTSLLNTSVLKVFKLDMMEAAKFAQKIGVAEAFTLKGTFAGLKEKPLKNKEEIVAAMKKHFFPNSSDDAVGKTVEILNTMIAEKKERISTEDLAEITFLLDDRDFEHLIDFLVGKRETFAAKAA